jgi:hypothetical protein
LRTLRAKVVGEGKWPAIVPEDTWRAVAEKLADPARLYGPSRARKHLLSNIAICGVCENGMGSGVNSGGKLIYTCKRCNRNSRNGAWLDAVVIEAVVARLSREDAADLITDTERPDVDALTEQRKALRDQQAALGTAHGDGKLSLAAFTAADKRLSELIDALTEQITDTDRAEVFADIIGPDADIRFAGLSLDRKRAVIAALLEITVKPSGRCGRVFRREDVDIQFRA